MEPLPVGENGSRLSHPKPYPGWRKRVEKLEPSVCPDDLHHDAAIRVPAPCHFVPLGFVERQFWNFSQERRARLDLQQSLGLSGAAFVITAEGFAASAWVGVAWAGLTWAEAAWAAPVCAGTGLGLADRDWDGMVWALPTPAIRRMTDQMSKGVLICGVVVFTKRCLPRELCLDFIFCVTVSSRGLVCDPSPFDVSLIPACTTL